jgi:hypothetical protein
MVGHLVVTHVGRVYGGRSAHDVHDREIHGDVPQQLAGGGPDERVELVEAVHARSLATALLPPALPQLPGDTPEEEGHRPHEEVGVEQEEVDVLGPAPPLLFVGVPEVAQCE